MLVQTILLTLTAFRTFGTGYGNLKVADDIHEIWFSIPVLTSIGTCTCVFQFPQSYGPMPLLSIVAFCVQGYYARHIYDMSKDLRVALVIGLVTAPRLSWMYFFFAYSAVAGHHAACWWNSIGCDPTRRPQVLKFPTSRCYHRYNGMSFFSCWLYFHKLTFCRSGTAQALYAT